MRLLRENVQMERLVGSTQGQTVVEGEITLPGGLREEARVLSAGGMVVLESAEALSDRVALEGKVVFHALYTQGDPTKICAIEASADFSHTLEMTGAAPRMLCRGEASVEHVEASAYNGRLVLKAILMIHMRVLSALPASAVTGISEIEGLELKTQTLPIKRTVAQGAEDALLREEFDLPEGLSIQDTLYGTARAALAEVTGGMGKANVTGTVSLEVYHTADLPSRPLVITRHTLPFERSVDISGEGGDTLGSRVTVKDVAVVSQDGGDGQRILRAEILLGVEAWADRQESVTVLADAYTTKEDDLTLASQQATYRIGDSALQTAESGKLMLMLPEGSPAARTMLCAFATPIVTGREQIGGRLTVEGMLEVTLLYMTDDSDVPVSVAQEEPFRLTFAAEAGEEDFLTLDIGDIDASAITSDRVEMKYIMRLNTQGLETAACKLVTDGETRKADPPMNAIALYFVQPGETLWDIARRYRVPVSQLWALNPDLHQTDPATGQGVVVWRRNID